MTIAVGDVMALGMGDDAGTGFADIGIIGKGCQMMTRIHLLPAVGRGN